MLARKALAGTAGAPKVYVEEVFSTYLTVGNATTTTITNDIDLSGKGGLVWLKDRTGAGYHSLGDTERSGKRLFSNTTDAETSNYPFSFTSSGFTANGNLLDSGRNFVSWTFRKAKKFFDVVTYTGNGSNRTISHNLGSVPGCIIVREYSSGGDWIVYHRSLGNTDYVRLNTTGATASLSTVWNNTTPTSTEFTVGTSNAVNANGASFVAYLFAHDAGGFGDAGSDNVISCGSFTTNGSGYFDVNLGYEPQWLLFKKSSGTGDWFLADNMRGMGVQALAPPMISANTSAAETTANGSFFYINSTGFGKSNNADLGANSTYIYIAIRRGPMKTPTSGTDVFAPVAYTGNSTSNTTVQNLTTNFAADKVMFFRRDTSGQSHLVMDKLRGSILTLYTDSTRVEEDINAYGAGQSVKFNNTQTVLTGQFTNFGDYNYNNSSLVAYNFRRAPGFFDVVCYTGAGAGTVTHNLGVVPEMIICKRRSGATRWAVYHSAIGATKYLSLNETSAETTDTGPWNNTTPTSSVFSVGGDFPTSYSGSTYVAYLFASLSGVSKVGSYTGNGSSVTVTTDFQPRFILVKRTDSTGDWIVSDSARGLVAGSDPYLLLNSTAAEDTDEDWVDITSTSFTVNQTTAANANVNTGTYIYLAIA